jgi:hypothetical protein
MPESYWTFSKTEKSGDEYIPKEVMRFFPDENGLIDVKIAEGFTLTKRKYKKRKKK